MTLAKRLQPEREGKKRVRETYPPKETYEKAR
jgi:hypothetical protein